MSIPGRPFLSPDPNFTGAHISAADFGPSAHICRFAKERMGKFCFKHLIID
jgi:hypothetical protein